MKPFVQPLCKTIQCESRMNMFVVLRFIFNVTTLQVRKVLTFAVAHTWISIQGLEGIVNGLRSEKLHAALEFKYMLRG